MRDGRSRNFNLMRSTSPDSSGRCLDTISIQKYLSPSLLTLADPADRDTINMSGGLFGAQANAAASSNTAQGDLSKDIAVNQAPEDSISDLRFSPAAEYLAVASWDKKVRIYEIDGNGNSQGKALFDHEGPVLSCCWSKVSGYISRVPIEA